MTPEAAAIEQPPPLAEISRDGLFRRLNDPSLTIVDALARESFEIHHIPGAVNLPVAEVEANARTLLPDPAAEIAIYCAKFT